jgi:hypothetical protein
MNLLKKLFVYSVVITTVLWSVGASFAPLSASAAGSYPAGSLLAMKGQSGAAVYLIGTDAKKHVFPSMKEYSTWYPNFDKVVRVAVAELDMYPDGAAVTVRPGTKLVTHKDTAKVYAIEPGGIARWIQTDTIAKALYGNNWTSRLVDVIPGFFSAYKSTGTTDISDKYPTGTVVKMGTTMYYIDGMTKRAFASDTAYAANGYVAADAVTVTALTGLTDGTSITGAEPAIKDFMPNTEAPVVVTDGALTVAAYNMPASMDLPESSPNDFMGIKLTAGSAAVGVDSITLTSFGLGASGNIDNVTFYNNGIKVGTSKNVTADKLATFNFTTPIAVPANGSVMLMVKATIADTPTVGLTYGLKLVSASDVVTGGTVGGSFPVMGNLMTSVAATIGTATLSSVNGTDDTSVAFGEDNVLLASFNLAAANEPILWQTARFRNAGTNSADVVSNMRIEVNGNVVKSGVALVDKYVDFNMGNLEIPKGNSVTVDVYGDIGVASTGNTIDLYIDNASDFTFLGKDYGYGIELTAASWALLNASGEGIINTLAASDFTVDMDKVASPSRDVKAGDDNVVLAVISFTSNGEDATINDISNTGSHATAAIDNGDFYISGTNATFAAGEITNVELRDKATGVIYSIEETASSTLGASYNEKGWRLAMTDPISLKSGVKKTFELRADLSASTDTDSIDNGDTLKVQLESTAMNVTGDISDAAISNITPSSVTGNILTVKDGSLTISTVALTSKSIVGGAADVVVYKAGLDVGASSNLVLNSFRVNATSTAYTAFTDNNISKLELYIVENGVSRLLKSVSNGITGDGTATGYINFTSLDTTNRVLKANVDVELEVRATFASSLNDGTTFTLEAMDSAVNTSYIVVKDASNVEVNEVVANPLTSSRVLTVAAVGTLKVELKTSDTKANDDVYILAGTSTIAGRYLGELIFTTAYEPIKLTGLALQEYKDSGDDDVKVVKLFDSTGNLVAYTTPSVDGHAYFVEADFVTGKNIFAADQSISYFIGVQTKSMNADGDGEGTADFDEGIQYSLATSTALGVFGLATDKAVVAKGVNSGTDVTCIEDTNGTLAAGEYNLASVKSKTATTTGAILTTITNTMADGTLSGGSGKVIGQYKFVFDNGSNRTTTNTELKAEMRTLILTIASSSGTLVTNVQAYKLGDQGNKTSVVQPNASNVATISLSTLTSDTELVDGEVTLVIIGDIGGDVTGAYVQTEINDLTTDFTYNGNNGAGAIHWSNALLNGISDVNGGNLSVGS